jgi:REP element-mobilizing transposase RayT
LKGCNQHSHAKLLRKGRYSEAGRIYLITTTTHLRLCWFDNLFNGRHVVCALQQAEHQAQTLAFVVMPDHLHWLMQLGDNTDLSGVVRSIKSASARTLNLSLGRRGRIWQSGYHDHALRSDEDVKHIARYVVANPLRAGLVESIGDYSLWDAVWL